MRCYPLTLLRLLSNVGRNQTVMYDFIFRKLFDYTLKSDGGNNTLLSLFAC